MEFNADRKNFRLIFQFSRLKFQFGLSIFILSRLVALASDLSVIEKEQQKLIRIGTISI